MTCIRAAFDIGSSHHKLTVAKLHPNSSLSFIILHSSSIRVPLADALQTVKPSTVHGTPPSPCASVPAASSAGRTNKADGRNEHGMAILPDEALLASREAVRELKSRAVMNGATVFSAVATAVFRAASNGEHYLASLSTMEGIHISVLSAEDEGALAFRTALSLSLFEGGRGGGVEIESRLGVALGVRRGVDDAIANESGSGSEGSSTDGDGVGRTWEEEEEEKNIYDGDENKDENDEEERTVMGCLREEEKMLLVMERSMVVWDAGGGSTQWTYRADDGTLGVHALSIGSAIVRAIFLSSLAYHGDASRATEDLSNWVGLHALPMRDASLKRKISRAPFVVGLGSPTSLFGLASRYTKTTIFTRAEVHLAVCCIASDYERRGYSRWCCDSQHVLLARAQVGVGAAASYRGGGGDDESQMTEEQQKMVSELSKLVLLFRLMLAYDIHAVRWLHANGSCVGLLTVAHDRRFWPSI